VSKNPEKSKPAWKTNATVFRLGLVSFFADISSEMLYPITPIFLTTVLGTSMSAVGLIEGVAEATASLLKTFSGRWSDRISKRKPFVFAGYLLAAVAKPLIGVSHSWPQVLAARALDRTGKGLRTAPRDAMIADSVERNQLGSAYGWHRGMDTMGAALGPLLSLWILEAKVLELRSIYTLALFPGLVAALLVLTLKEKPVVPAEKAAREKIHWSKLPAGFLIFLTSTALFSIVNSSDAFLLLKATNASVSVTSVILMYCAYNLVYAFSSPFLGRWADHIPKKYLLILGLVVFAGVYLGFSQAHSHGQFVILFLIYGLYMGATDGVSKALCVELTPGLPKATILGLQGTVSGLCTLVASAMAGWLWDHAGAGWTFIYGAVGALMAAFVLFFVKTDQRRS
jgi:MFS family permease